MIIILQLMELSVFADNAGDPGVGIANRSFRPVSSVVTDIQKSSEISKSYFTGIADADEWVNRNIDSTVKTILIGHVGHNFPVEQVTLAQAVDAYNRKHGTNIKIEVVDGLSNNEEIDDFLQKAQNAEDHFIELIKYQEPDTGVAIYEKSFKRIYRESIIHLKHMLGINGRKAEFYSIVREMPKKKPLGEVVTNIGGAIIKLAITSGVVIYAAKHSSDDAAIVAPLIVNALDNLIFSYWAMDRQNFLNVGKKYNADSKSFVNNGAWVLFGSYILSAIVRVSMAVAKVKALPADFHFGWDYFMTMAAFAGGVLSNGLLTSAKAAGAKYIPEIAQLFLRNRYWSSMGSSGRLINNGIAQAVSILLTSITILEVFKGRGNLAETVRLYLTVAGTIGFGAFVYKNAEELVGTVCKTTANVLKFLRIRNIKGVMKHIAWNSTGISNLLLTASFFVDAFRGTTYFTDAAKYFLSNMDLMGSAAGLDKYMEWTSGMKELSKTYLVVQKVPSITDSQKSAEIYYTSDYQQRRKKEGALQVSDDIDSHRAIAANWKLHCRARTSMLLSEINGIVKK